MTCGLNLRCILINSIENFPQNDKRLISLKAYIYINVLGNSMPDKKIQKNGL